MVIIALIDRKRREEEEAARRAAKAARTDSEAIPQTDLPSREGDDTVRVAEANDAEVAEKEAAPELEPSKVIPEASKDDSEARNKGKGIAAQKDEPSKKKRKLTSGDPAARKLVVDDPDASAVMFARVNNANTRLPPPEKLRRPRSYGAMAQRVVAAINELMTEYETDLSKAERHLDEARNETAASKVKLEEAQNEAATAKGKLGEAMARASRLEEEKIVLSANVDKVSASVIRLE
ncbi:uncharacterized protein LOC112088591 [Eutrema salsugineum]|uniref:uncharacterized protein LOC112088591 n=1 Tax=Eutrema salsugineum TaxID=72664 RepID=UPI000CED6FDD|nr:uncharacterized protein LOC112088591 [Eutrema salsugineum]